jgi:TolB-like protein
MDRRSSMPFHVFGENERIKLGESIADRLARELSPLAALRSCHPKPHAPSLKSLDARQVRRELGVAYVVEGRAAFAQQGLHAGNPHQGLHDTLPPVLGGCRRN